MSKKCEACGNTVGEEAAFCPQCGNAFSPAALACPSCKTENDPKAKFCKACGTALAPAPVPQRLSSNPAPVPLRESKNFGLLVGILDIACIVLSFFSWVRLDVILWSGEYSIPSLFLSIIDLNSNITSVIGSSSSAYNQASSAIIGMAVLFAIAWAIIVIYLARDAYQSLSGKEKRPAANGLMIFGLFALVCCIAFLILNASVSSQMGSMSRYVAVSLVSPTLGAWASAAVGIVGYCVARSKRMSVSSRVEDKSEEPAPIVKEGEDRSALGMNGAVEREDGVSAPSNTSDDANREGRIVCAYCGDTLISGKGFCPGCGKPISD